jgi:thiamine biosynthesis lipoprotein ApbE
MFRRSPLALLALGCCLGGPHPGVAGEYVVHHENVMGTSLELRLRADSPEAARRAEATVLREIERLSSIFSGYDPKSEFSRWQAASAGPVRVSPELFEVLRACDRWREASGGAFDPRVEALTRLWSACAKRDRSPSPEELAQVRAMMKAIAWRLDPDAGTAEYLTDCPLSLNAIAKGYIVEHACSVAMREGGVRGLLLNVGGDLRACGEGPWTIGVASPWDDSDASEPLTSIEVRDRAVATSGRSRRGFRIGGRWYSHILDPRTGRPVERVAGASVIAERSADADALATIFNVLEPEESLRLARALPGVECLIALADGRIVRSDGWPRYERARPDPTALATGQKPTDPGKGASDGDKKSKAGRGGSWGDEFELVVNFEINRPDPDEGPYRRPYVAIWVADKDGHQLRTLALWISYGGAAPYPWLPDLRHWHRSDLERTRTDKTDLVETIARPTRPPGKYKVAWDGKDNHGKPLGPGEYTIYVEAAREHGTKQSIRKKVTIADRPFAEDLEGNVEIKSASLEYRRKAQGK